MNFSSDNVTGAAPEILAALSAAAQGGPAMPYGADDWTKRVGARLAEIFEREVAVFPVATGSAANSLALSALVPVYGAIFCHPDAHIAVDECGAPEFFTGGAKLVPIGGEHGKIRAADLARVLDGAGAGIVHHVQPAAVSLSQTTEAGTVYRPDEIAAIAEVAHRHALKVHMDGARFANALLAAGCRPAELTWRAGVDALSFGATKNGALAAEAVVFFNPADARDFGYRRKRGGHLFSKMRFLSAQLEAYLANDLWLKHAAHANRLARRLADGLSTLPGARLLHPVEANELFLWLPEPVIAGLLDAGFGFYRWVEAGPGVIRLVTAFNSEARDVELMIETARRLAAVPPAAETRRLAGGE
jgi:threonine aldolase